MPSITLKPGKEKPVLNRHPWIFSGAIAKIPSDVKDGQVVDVLDSRTKFLARGYLNRRSQITVRLLTWDEAEQVDTAFWTRRLQQAIERRQDLLSPKTSTACTLAAAIPSCTPLGWPATRECSPTCGGSRPRDGRFMPSVAA